DGRSDPLTEYGRQLGLALAAIEDRLEERRIGVAVARPQRRLEERPERRHLRRHLAFLEPEIDVPLAPGVEIDPGEDEPPLAAVRYDRELFVARAEPLEDAAEGPAPAPDADALLRLEEDRQDAAVLRPPEQARLDGFAGYRAAGPVRRHLRAALPGSAPVIESADLVEDVEDEIGSLRRTVIEKTRPAAELESSARVERRWDVLFEGAQPLGIEEEPAVAEAVPADAANEVIGAELRHHLCKSSTILMCSLFSAASRAVAPRLFSMVGSAP